MPGQTQLISHHPFLPQILPLKETCGEFLFELLTARHCLDLLLELTEKYACTRARRMLSQQMAQNFEALLEEGALWQLPCRVWQEMLMQDCLAVSCCTAPVLVTYNQHQHACHHRCTSQLCTVPVQVANEAAVLSAVRQYAQLQGSNGVRDSVMERVTPSSPLPEEVLDQPNSFASQETVSHICLLPRLPISADTTHDCNWHDRCCVLQTVHLPSFRGRWQQGSVLPAC